MKSRFFYHDGAIERRWEEQKNDGFFEKTDFGSFSKERYPFGYRSALIFVDHCDFDTTEKEEAIYYGTSDKNSPDYGRKGIVGTGLTATKTIFIDGREMGNIGLENKDYQRIIEELAENKIEIVPHSLRPKLSYKKDNLVLESDLLEMEKYGAKTWVDHGYGLNNINRFGFKKQSPYYIFDKLFEKGYRYFWSRIDYSLNAPDGNLNLFNNKGRAGKDYLKKVSRLIKEGEKIEKIVFVFFWDFVGCLIGWEAKDDLVYSTDTIFYLFKRLFGKQCSPPLNFSRRAIARTLLRIINPLFYYQVCKNFFKPDRITSLVNGFYPVLIEGEQIYFFDSLWINDCVSCYSPKNIDRLIKEKGLHIGHNYLSVEESHYLNLNFEKIGENYFINEDFQKNLKYLAECQRQKKIWVTTISDYGQYCSRWLKVKVENISSKKILIANLNDCPVSGFTVSYKSKKAKINIKLSKTKKFNQLKREDEVIIWVDLEPFEKLILTIV